MKVKSSRAEVVKKKVNSAMNHDRCISTSVISLHCRAHQPLLTCSGWCGQALKNR